MPKEKKMHLDNVLEHLEDTTLNTHLSKSNNYQELQSILSSDLTVDIKIYEKILAICVRDLKEDIQYTTYALAIINTILLKIKNGECSALLNLVPSAVIIVHNVKSIASSNKYNALKILFFETLLSYPDDTLIAVATTHKEELIEIFDVYCVSLQMTFESKHLALKLLLKLLKMLISTKRDIFVKEFVSVWFSRVFPTIMSLAAADKDFEYVKILELLTESLVLVDYSQNPKWKTIFECIYNPQKYPAIMKNLLEIGSNIWHILWIIFIKLLKNQITQVSDSNGSPINAMLPVVELAFKMDTINRCRAFQCWDALIDNFSSEANESFAVKRIKLLIIPLKANNARVEETALAKLSTWWHLIRKFHSKIDKFTDVILIPFLHFCFGKANTPGKKQLIPGNISNNVKRQCVQALVEISGHVDCEGCVTLPKLKQRLISTNLLADHWNDWMHSLKVAIKTSADNPTELMGQQLTCLWKSFAMTIGELPENNIRRDMFNDFLSIIQNLLKDCSSENKLAHIIFQVLISSLFDDENKINQLLRSKDGQQGPIHTILSILVSPKLENIYKSIDMKKLISNFKPITNFVMSESANTRDDLVDWLLKHLPASDNTLALWTALSESIYESEYDLNASNLCNVLLWPLKSMTFFINANTSNVWYKWYTLYDSSYLNLRNTSLETDISKLLMIKSEMDPSTVHFMLSASLAILKRKLLYESNVCEGDVDILLSIMTKSHDCGSIKEVYPLLVDTLVLMINKATETVNISLATQALTAVKIVLKSQVTHLQSNESNRITFVENLFNPLNALFQIGPYTDLIIIVADDLIQCLLVDDKQYVLKTNALSLLKMFMTKMKEGNGNPLYIKIKTAIDAVDGKNDCIKKTTDSNFAAPKETTKKVKKKEPSIVSTIVENGEEYVVVKSNWKFNPRKLTENQKEKFKRKREDIPALYQDLSQSQDEFKLTTWKTDSQDTSTTTSRSASKSADEDVSTILKNIPGSNVVPKIMENFLSENTSLETTITPTKHQDAARPRTGLKDVKTPRMALKDRVFKNVRNLIEKSNLPKEAKSLTKDLNVTVTDNILKTPELKEKNTTELTTSAPPKISSERPSRIIKKPKKFDDTEVFPLIRRRRSQNDSPPDDTDIVNLDLNDKTNTKNKDTTIEPNNGIDESKGSEIPSMQLDKNLVNDIDCVPVTESATLCIAITDKEIKNSQVSQTNTGTEYCDNTPGKSDVVHNADDMRNLVTSNKEPIKSSDEIISSEGNEDVSPKSIAKKKGLDDPKSSVKKKRSRIEKQLCIDMVEGHPFLQTKIEKRATRKNILTPTNNYKRNTVTEKLNKAKSETKSSSKSDRKVKEKDKSPTVSKSETVTVVETLEKSFESSEDFPMSEDIIESSQDSTLTTISVRSTKKVSKRVPIVRLDKKNDLIKFKELGDTQKLLHDFGSDIAPLNDTLPLEQESKEDIELPKNKTAVEENAQIDLTENMDTQPIEDKDCSSDVIVINDIDSTPIVINTEDTFVGPETQEIAEADTQPMELDSQTTNKVNHIESVELNSASAVNLEVQHSDINTVNNSEIEDTQEDLTRTISEPVKVSVPEHKKTNGACSPLNDEGQRKKDFLDDTVEISPIKSMSPVREDKSPSPETSSDYVVIKLTSPVQSNGEPYNEKCDSPEIFTEEKISPDKRDQSPPRVKLSVSNNSPSSCLSLKKNRPQMRSGGRAAQMLGLCAPDKLMAIMNSDRYTENEEPKKSTSLSTPARRNLRILYNSVIDNNDSPNEADNEDSENFLKFKRCVPTADCSPSGPILKRKLADMADEATISPASKRKRVSFHDPPVSTTIAVQKYIEPGGIRSPQSSALKRQERQMQMRPANMKSPKRLDNVFRLETILTKAVESFTDNATITLEDTEMSSIDETPIVEVVKTCELNDTDPIFSELAYCNDPIEKIAIELSSPAMKELLIKELKGKVETIADLAKMTELEVNRLCIKAPKVQVTKKVLSDYALKKAVELQNENKITKEPESVLVHTTVPEIQGVDVEVQTSIALANSEMQTESATVTVVETQTDTVSTMHTSAQTNESGSKTTADIVKSCLTKPDFIEQLSLQLEESSIQKLAENISFNSSLELLMDKMSAAQTNEVLSRVVERNTLDSSNEQCTSKQLTIFQEYLCDRFGSKDLILFCSKLLQKIHEKSA